MRNTSCISYTLFSWGRGVTHGKYEVIKEGWFDSKCASKMGSGVGEDRAGDGEMGVGGRADAKGCLPQYPISPPLLHSICVMVMLNL